MNVSFSGCGFLGIYHIGVASALQKYAPDFLLNKIGGASGGGIAACALICNICLGQATSVVLKVAIKARKNALGPLHPSFSLNNIVREEFYSKEDLVDALVCSAFIPFYSGTKAPKFRGEKYIDGGWSDNLPILGENTITVSPFSVALFPPHPEVMSDMCQQGFEDTLRFLASHNLFHCAHCIAVRSCVFMKDEQQRNKEEGTTERGRILPRRVSITNPDHRPVEFDCKRCKDTAARAPRKGLPDVIRASFSEAIAYENSILRYFFYSRPVTLLRILSLPWMLPLDLSFLMMKKLFVGVPSKMIKSTKDILQFIFNQVDIQNRLYGPSFKCSLNVKDLSYSTFSADVASNFDALQVHRHFSLPTGSNENNQYLMREMKFDFSVDGDDIPTNETTQKLSDIFTNEDLDGSVQLSSDSIGKAVEELEWERLQQASIIKEDFGNVGSLDNVLDYARKHDALMAFYYLDEQNFLKVREFFQLEESSSSEKMKDL
ncbi:Patanin-like phospholipase domain-containing protein [Trichinella pseudospiralis]